MSSKWVCTLAVLVAACGPGAIYNPPVTSFPGHVIGEAQLGNVATVTDTVAEGFVPNGYFAAVAPVGDTVVSAQGSFTQAGDAATGRIRLVIPAVELTSPLAVPIITGPNSDNLSMEVSCSSYQRSHRLPTSSQWTWFVLPLDACDGASEVSLTFVDAGNGWGQWMAIGKPRRVVYSQLSRERRH